MPLFPLNTPTYYNVKNYGARGNGSVDDTTAITTAIATAKAGTGGGVIYFPPGTYLFSSQLVLDSQNLTLMGSGSGSILQASPSFSASSLIALSADYCGVRDLRIRYANSTSSTNPVANAIEVTGARYAYFRSLRFFYINGWAIESVGTASVNNVGCFMDAIHVEHCAQGIHVQGNSGSNYVGQMFLSNIHVEVIDNGDALFFEDINDMEVVNINGAVAGGSTAGSMIHIKGNSNSHFFSNIDLGAITRSTTSATILIESGTGGSPSNITMVSGVIQQGSNGIQITSGADIKFTSIKLKSSNTDGVQVTGGSGPFTFEDCQFATNNQANSTAYDMNLTTSTGFAYIRHCIFQSPVGSGAGNVSNPVNDANHRGYFLSCHFAGSGSSPSLVFASGGTPQIIRGCVGYNPRGSITPTSIGASPFTGNSSQHDITIYFTALGGMTAFKIGGTSIGVVPSTGVGYRVPARQSFEIDYTTTAPTYIWFAD